MRPVFAARGDDEKMKEAMGNYMKNSFEPMSDRLEKQLAENDTGFVVGNQVSGLRPLASSDAARLLIGRFDVCRIVCMDNARLS